MNIKSADVSLISSQEIQVVLGGGRSGQGTGRGERPEFSNRRLEILPAL
jgi:hypothetical protein